MIKNMDDTISLYSQAKEMAEKSGYTWEKLSPAGKRKWTEQIEQGMYRRLSGEIESRDTAARMGLSAVERARQLPYSGQGIPLKDTITKMGVAAPVGAILAERMAQRKSQAEAWEGQGLEDAVNPVEYLIPGRWGGGAINMLIDTATGMILGR